VGHPAPPPPRRPEPTPRASEEEIESLVATYADYQQGVESLYADPETRYASPALIFNAAPVFADWAE